jgi:micrococcal nuclease
VSLYTYRAILVRFIDADTIVADIDCGFRLWKRNEHLRLVGINAPDKQPNKGLATSIARQLVPDGSPITVRTERDAGDKYGRWLATITTDTLEVSVNDMLVQMGAAVPWSGKGVRPEVGA